MPDGCFKGFLGGLFLLRQRTQNRALVRSQCFQVQHLATLGGNGLQNACFTAARCRAQHPPMQTRRQFGCCLDHLMPKGLVAAVEPVGRPADLAQDDLHGAAALSAAPAVNERLPVFGVVGKSLLDVLCDVACDQDSAKFAGFERRDLLVERAHLGTFGIAQYRAIDGSRYMVFGKFCRAAHINDGVISRGEKHFWWN